MEQPLCRIGSIGLYLYFQILCTDAIPPEKTRIGKIDLKTGATVYTAEYLSRMAATGASIQQEAVTPSPEVQLAGHVLDTSRRYGSHLLFRNLANSIGLLDTLKEALPKTFREIFALACFLVETQEPLAYFEEWLSLSKDFEK